MLYFLILFINRGRVFITQRKHPISEQKSSEHVPNKIVVPGEHTKIGSSPLPGITLRNILGHSDQINRIAWSPDGHYLAILSRDRNIAIWDFENGEQVAVLSKHQHHVNSVAWSPDGKRLASCSSDKSVFIWDTKTWKVLGFK